MEADCGEHLVIANLGPTTARSSRYVAGQG